MNYVNPISVGSLINFETEGEFDLNNKLTKAQFDLLGTHNISTLHDNTKNMNRILHQMKNTPLVNLGDDLDSQYMSKQIKNMREGKSKLMAEIDKVSRMNKEVKQTNRGKILYIHC